METIVVRRRHGAGGAAFGRGTDQFERIAEESSETIDRRPASIVVVRSKFVPKGQGRGAVTQVRQRAPLELPIERGLAGPGILADTIVGRWADHTPLYRMERIYGRGGLKLARQTISDWHLALAELARSLLDAMWADACKSPYLWVDATGVLVLHSRSARTGTSSWSPHPRST